MTNHEAALANLAGVRHEHLLYYARRAYEHIHRIRPRRYGVSSDSMVDHALGLRGEPGIILYPADTADLDACELAYKTAPADLQSLMLPILEKYRAHIDERFVHAAGCRKAEKPPEGYPSPTFSCNCRGASALERRHG